MHAAPILWDTEDGVLSKKIRLQGESQEGTAIDEVDGPGLHSAGKTDNRVWWRSQDISLPSEESGYKLSEPGLAL
jgi:hypothetical protein